MRGGGGVHGERIRHAENENQNATERNRGGIARGKRESEGIVHGGGTRKEHVTEFHDESQRAVGERYSTLEREPSDARGGANLDAGEKRKEKNRTCAERKTAKENSSR